MGKHQKNTSLRSIFLTRLFIILLIIVVLSGMVQLYFINQQISQDIEKQSQVTSSSIEQGITETNTASKAIEKQIDLKLMAISHQIGELLNNKTEDQITNEELIQIRDQLHLTGLTILLPKDDDIIGYKSTDPKDVGFSFKKFGGPGYSIISSVVKYEVTKDPFVTTATNDFFAIPIAQSGAHNDKPTFFKYAYYHPPGRNYIIDPFLEANEVYNFTNEVGPNSWISKALNSNPYVTEIAVLDPKVFKDPSLEEKVYPPLKKIVYGTFDHKSVGDENVLSSMADNPQKTSYIEKVDGTKLYKHFVPLKDGNMIYIALDYSKMSEPLYRHSAILLVSGLVSLIALFLITARFFNRIYENIQRIKTQMKLLEAGDFTAKSKVNDSSELGKLSESANRMVDTLHQLLKDTSESARKAQRLSVHLEADANQSVQRMFTISMETTMNSREHLDEIMNFLNIVEVYHASQFDHEKGKEIQEKIAAMREIANDRTAATTDMTITLSDLLKSLHSQSSELSDISNNLLQHIAKFKLC